MAIKRSHLGLVANCGLLSDRANVSKAEVSAACRDTPGAVFRLEARVLDVGISYGAR